MLNKIDPNNILDVFVNEYQCKPQTECSLKTLKHIHSNGNVFLAVLLRSGECTHYSVSCASVERLLSAKESVLCHADETQTSLHTPVSL